MILEILQCIPACPVGLADRTGVVIIFAFLNLGKNISFSENLLCVKKNSKINSLDFGLLFADLNPTYKNSWFLFKTRGLKCIPQTKEENSPRHGITLDIFIILIKEVLDLSPQSDTSILFIMKDLFG